MKCPKCKHEFGTKGPKGWPKKLALYRQRYVRNKELKEVGVLTGRSINLLTRAMDSGHFVTIEDIRFAVVSGLISRFRNCGPHTIAEISYWLERDPTRIPGRLVTDRSRRKR